MRVCKERETEKLISLREKFKEEFTNWYSIILVNYRGLRQALKLHLLFPT
jgi:hypothetical protein